MLAGREGKRAIARATRARERVRQRERERDSARARASERQREKESDGTKADGRLCWLLAAAAATQVETKCTRV